MTPHSGPADEGEAALSRAIEAMTAEWAGLIEAAAVRFGLQGFERDDLTQRVRLRLWRALERRGPQGSSAAPPAINPSYGYQAAVSAAIDIVRERRSQRSAERVPLDTVSNTLAATPEGPTESELVAALDTALGRLDPARRVAVRLHLSGLHLRDIAIMAGWTEAKARNLLYRGLDDLRVALAGEG